MTQRDRTPREDSQSRLSRETAALRRLFQDPGYYEVRRPDGTTRRIFVLCRAPWRFARVGLLTGARRAEVQG